MFDKIGTVGALATLVLVAGCDEKADTPVGVAPAARSEPTAMEIVSATGPAACIQPEVLATAYSIIEDHVNFAGESYVVGVIRYGMHLSPADETEFRGETFSEIDEGLMALTMADAMTKKTSCSTQYNVEYGGKKWRAPIAISVQPNAAGDDFIVEVNGISNIQDAVNFARGWYEESVILPDMRAERAEAEAARIEAANAKTVDADQTADVPETD